MGEETGRGEMRRRIRREVVVSGGEVAFVVGFGVVVVVVVVVVVEGLSPVEERNRLFND